MIKNMQTKLRTQIVKVIGKKEIDDKANFLSIHLEEIREEAGNISLLIEKITKEKISANKLHYILIEIKVRGSHLKDHLTEFIKPNEQILVELDKIIYPKK